MKLFRKAMAVMLAGVLALTVLTGCSSSINHKEIVAVMNDLIKSKFGGDINITLKETSSEQADKMITLMKNGFETDKENFDAEYFFTDSPYNQEHRKNAKDALGITDDTKDFYAVMVTKVTSYAGTYNKAHPTYTMLENGVVSTLSRMSYFPSSNGTLSMNTVTFDGAEYLVLVIKIAA